MRQLDRDDVLNATTKAGIEDDNVREGYRGRWCAKEGFGIVGSISDFGVFLAEMARIAVENDNGEGVTMRDVSDLADAVRTDSMGEHEIFYFPGFALTEED